MAENCIFCKIIKGEIGGNFIRRKKDYVAFKDINPKAPVHVLIVPVKHYASLENADDKDKLLLGDLMIAVRDIARKLKISESGYKIVINNGEDSGQLVFHMHIHLLGGWQKVSHWKV